MAPVGTIYSATYSNTPVYEIIVERLAPVSKKSGDSKNDNDSSTGYGTESVMRRKHDHYVNGTHILKAAGLDKPQRTRILEGVYRDGFHERVQGGYGKFQGTWMPLDDAAKLADTHGVHDRVRPLLEYVPGNTSPPPAPKHATASTRNPRPIKAPKTRKIANQSQSDSHAESSMMATPFHDMQDVTVESQYDPNEYAQDIVDTSSMVGDPDMGPDTTSIMEDDVEPLDHTDYYNEVLDSWIAGLPGDVMRALRNLPEDFDVNITKDHEGVSLLHWAASMADLEAMKYLINERGALLTLQTNAGETCLVRSCLFTNSFEKKNFLQIVSILNRSIWTKDWFNATVFHHLAQASRTYNKRASSRYYAEVLIKYLIEYCSPAAVESILQDQDNDGSTPALITYKCGGDLTLGKFFLLHSNNSAVIKDKEGDNCVSMLKYRGLLDSKHSPANSDTDDAATVMSDGSYEEVGAGQDSNGRAHADQVIGTKIITKLDRKFDNAVQSQLELEKVVSQLRLTQDALDRAILIEEHDATLDPEGIMTDAEKSYAAICEVNEYLAEQLCFEKRSDFVDEFPGSYQLISPAGYNEYCNFMNGVIMVQALRVESLRERFSAEATSELDQALKVQKQLVLEATGLGEEELDAMVDDILERLKHLAPAPLPAFANEMVLDHSEM